MSPPFADDQLIAGLDVTLHNFRVGTVVETETTVIAVGFPSRRIQSHDEPSVDVLGLPAPFVTASSLGE
jgi:hypothetical protein